MQKISKLLLRAGAQTQAQTSGNLLQTPSFRAQPFSIQTEMQAFDFTEKINAVEL